TPTSNGLPDVASFMRFGVVPKKISSLWPEACSNCGLISAQTPDIAPPARTLSSAACTLADDDGTSARPSTEAATVSEYLFMTKHLIDCSALLLDFPDDTRTSIDVSRYSCKTDGYAPCLSWVKSAVLNVGWPFPVRISGPLRVYGVRYRLM